MTQILRLKVFFFYFSLKIDAKKKKESLSNSIPTCIYHYYLCLIDITRILSLNYWNNMNSFDIHFAEIWKSNSLTGLYEFFKDGKGKSLVMNAPDIRLVDENAVGNYKTFLGI